MWSSENNLIELVLSFYHVGPGDWIQVIKLDNKHFARGTILTGSPMYVLFSQARFAFQLSHTHCHHHSVTIRTVLVEFSSYTKQPPRVG